MRRNLILAAIAATALAPSARAQNTTTTTQTRTAPAPAATAGQKGAVNDALFAAVAGASGLSEVAISRLGAQRATDADLKKFSQQMIQDHTKANQELTTLASEKRFPIPTALDAKAEFCSQNLAGLSGEDFDRCYAKAQLVAHMEAVATFEAEAQRGQDPVLKAWASRTLPTLKDHLKMIKPIAMKYEKEKEKSDSDHEEK